MQLVVFEENGSKKNKVDGIKAHGAAMHIQVFSIVGVFPDFIDEPEEYITNEFSGDLVLNYLKHPDLSDYLIAVCKQKKIPVIAPGKKTDDAFTPFTCCGLGKFTATGIYGEKFGFPEYRIELDGETISSLEVVRGAPCGATWDVLTKVIGKTVTEAMHLLPREIQYLCTADPAGFDPITGKSPVHYAGYVHIAALKKAVEAARKKE